MFSNNPLKKDGDAAVPQKDGETEGSSQNLESNLQPIDPSLLSADSENGNIGDVAGNPIDLDAILAANTSQLFAMAAEASDKSKEVVDPFLPSSEQGNMAESNADKIGEAQAGESSASSIDGLVFDENPADATKDDGAVKEAPAADVDEPAERADDQAGGVQGAANESAAYSRENASYKHRKGWRALGTGKKVALSLILVLAILLSVAAGVGIALLKNAQDELALDEGIQESLTPVQADIDPYWMLVLGSDSRNESTDRARSDVLMLVRIDPQAPKVAMVSIPRDTRVTIEGYGTQKINAAYALGGAELAIKTVEEYSGVKISHYAEIYFTGLEDLVNQLGGVTVDVPEHCKYSDVELQPGVQTLTGHEALIFARCRKTYSEGDFTRTKCQRILLEAMVEKVLEKPVTELPEVVASTAKCFSTDIPLSDLVALAQKMQSSGNAEFYSAMAPSTTGMVGGVSYTFTYTNQWKLLMQRAANGEKPVISKKEAEILGYDNTAYADMDMTTSIPEETMAALQAHWDKKAAKAAKKSQEAANGASQQGAASVASDANAASGEKTE